MNHSIKTCLTVLSLFCWLIIVPSNAVACGWAGDAESDDSDGVEWADDLDSQTQRGNQYRTGTGVERDYDIAIYWYYKAAEQGHAVAQNNLAAMYEQGLGVPKNIPEAAKWYLKAAEQHNAFAQHSIGRMYRDGDGVPQDLEEATKWIRRAAEQGHHSACRDLGEMYWKGSGVPQNNVLAYMWWRLGAVHGDKESERLLSMAAVKMTSSSVKEAEILAQKWIQKDN